MAAGNLPEPGTELGPCVEQCAHVDCAQTRKMAETDCGLCGKSIGYGVRFYAAGRQDEGLVHAECLERQSD